MINKHPNKLSCVNKNTSLCENLEHALIVGGRERERVADLLNTFSNIKQKTKEVELRSNGGWKNMNINFCKYLKFLQID